MLYLAAFQLKWSRFRGNVWGCRAWRYQRFGRVITCSGGLARGVLYDHLIKWTLGWDGRVGIYPSSKLSTKIWWYLPEKKWEIPWCHVVYQKAILKKNLPRFIQQWFWVMFNNWEDGAFFHDQWFMRIARSPNFTVRVRLFKSFKKVGNFSIHLTKASLTK